MTYIPHKVKKALFKGKKYNIEWKTIPDETVIVGKKKIKVKIYGLCDSPKESEEERKITISPQQSEKDLLITCIDEGIHACNFSIRNDVVNRMSTSIGEFLWKIGFRIKKTKKKSYSTKKQNKNKKYMTKKKWPVRIASQQKRRKKRTTKN